MKGVPKILFDPGDFEPDAAAGAWSQLFQFLHRAKPIDVPDRPFASFVHSYIVDGLIFGDGHFALQTMTFDEERDVVLSGEKYLVSWVLSRGRMNILHDGEMLDVDPGEYCLIDQSRQSHALLTDSDVLSVIIPHSAIGYDPAIHPARVHVDLSSPGAKALYDDLQMIAKAAPTMTRRDAPAYGRHHKDLLISLLETAPAMEMQSANDAKQIRAEIDEHIFYERLTLDRVMEMVGKSRAQVLDAIGLPASFETYLAERRMVYALRSLAFGSADPAWLADVARLMGYPDTSAFETAFAAQFGFPPSVILGVLADAGPRRKDPENNRLWAGWLSG